MSLKGKITNIIYTEARAILNEFYATNNTKNQSNSGVKPGTVDKYDAETGLLTIKHSDGTITTKVNPGGAPVGPGTVGVVVGGIFIY